MTTADAVSAPPPDHGGGRPSWPPDRSLVSSAKAGDQRALAVLLSGGYPRLVGFFRTAGIRPAEAEDLAADTVEALIRHLPRLRKVGAFEAWFWTIARTQLKSWIRKNRRPVRNPPIDPAPPDPSERLETSEEHDRIRQALERLPDRDRQLLWLREVEGLSYEEIGGRLQAAVGTVRVACHRARQRLEDAYQRLEGNGPSSR